MEPENQIPKDVVVKSHTNSGRTFAYKLNSTNLDFSLRTDIDTDLREFLKLLEEAVIDVKKELEKFEPKYV